ncbi:MAG: radical SAM family heme chaperone HemW, partial [Proteobacteria bacterium]|nr:radical SAM family heme chaperone HemW [Pseudomonadota bacterium]
MKNHLSIYMHWPFCIAKCPYCNFNVHIVQDMKEDEMLSAYCMEIEYYKEYLKDKNIISVFFGGGTPSLVSQYFIESFLECLKKHSNSFDKNIEITLEANPENISYKLLLAFKNAGINRLSLGVQSFKDDELKFLGRSHSGDIAKNALLDTAKIFDNYSVDLIYGLPNQTNKDWELALTKVLKEDIKHLSLYQLTIEKGTQFFSDVKSQIIKMPIDERLADLYKITHEITVNYGLNAYEISNHAKKNYQSIHNMNYWQYGDYLGIGPGAHGRYTRDGKKFATLNFSPPQKWMSRILKYKHSVQKCHELSLEELFNEKIAVGLRMFSGIKIDDKFYNQIKTKIDFLIKNKLICYLDNVMKIT